MYLDQGAWLQMGLEDLLHATSVYEQLGLRTVIRLVVAAKHTIPGFRLPMPNPAPPVPMVVST